MNDIVDQASNNFNQSQYETNAEAYLESNSDGSIGGISPEERVKMLQAVLPAGRAVLEIGSGGGLDALALKAVGYQVTASDYVPEFLNELRRQGLPAIVLDAKNDDIPHGFSALYANAVFVHFSPEEFADCLIRAHDKLENERIVFASFIKGEGSQRSGRSRGFERDFHYYTLESLEKLIMTIHYKVVGYNEPDGKWLQALLQAV